MNLPRTEWNENVKHDLLVFLKAANECKANRYCNIKEYDRSKSLFPLSESLKDELQIYEANITLSDDKESRICEGFNANLNDRTVLSPQTHKSLYFYNEETKCKELAEAIRDSIIVEKAIPKTLLFDLVNLDSTNVVNCFCYLTRELNLEDLKHLWNSFNTHNITNETVIVNYINILYFPKVKQEFVYEMHEVLLGLCQRHGTLLKNELVKEFIKIDQDSEAPNALVQYVALLDNDYKTNILRDFTCTIEKLHLNYIPIIEPLLNSQIHNDVLIKLIEIMAASSEFCNYNPYGKLLFKVVSLCERNLSGLEQPLKRILGMHKSIWKIKVEKIVFNSLFNDSLTQSFM